MTWDRLAKIIDRDSSHAVFILLQCSNHKESMTYGSRAAVQHIRSSLRRSSLGGYHSTRRMVMNYWQFLQGKPLQYGPANSPDAPPLQL